MDEIKNEEVEVQPVEAPKPELIEVDLEDKEIKLGGIVYAGKFKCLPAIADQLIALKPFAAKKGSLSSLK